MEVSSETTSVARMFSSDRTKQFESGKEGAEAGLPRVEEGEGD